MSQQCTIKSASALLSRCNTAACRRKRSTNELSNCEGSSLGTTSKSSEQASAHAAEVSELHGQQLSALLDSTKQGSNRVCVSLTTLVCPTKPEACSDMKPQMQGSMTTTIAALDLRIPRAIV
eukprot:7810-Heterococcus_DN1.PRE.3